MHFVKKSAVRYIYIYIYSLNKGVNELVLLLYKLISLYEIRHKKFVQNGADFFLIFLHTCTCKAVKLLWPNLCVFRNIIF